MAKRRTLLYALLLLIAGALAYANSLRGEFVFDDALLTESGSMLRPDRLGEIARGPRPVADLTFAANYAAGGLNPRGYHVVNGGLHLLAGLGLFGAMRRLLRSPRLGERYGERASGLAFATALLWLVHPLQTESVTYIIQRSEVLAGLFYFLTVYLALRGFESARPWGWHAGAIAACALGMGSKPVMATAPLVVLICDGLFVSASWREALRRHGRLYAGLALTWGLLLLTLGETGETAGFRLEELTPWRYLRSQFGVVLHYLRLSVWPDDLCLDYSWPIAYRWADIVPQGVAVGALAGATLWGLARRRAWSFAGVWFFGILSVTSSFMPLVDLCFEHRMYLPLAAVTAAAALGVDYALGRMKGRVSATRVTMIGAGLLALAAAGLGARTVARNGDYARESGIWRDVLRQYPGNVRAMANLGGGALRKEGDLAGALEWTGRILEYRDDALAHYNLGQIYRDLGRAPEAMEEFRAAARLDPKDYRARNNLGILLAQQGRIPEAAEQFREAVAIAPEYGPARENLAQALRLLPKAE